jgi:hypothetical protein
MPIYALTRNAFGSGDRMPIYCVDADGYTSHVADIRPLASGGFFVHCQAGAPSILPGEAGNGYFDDLPYYLQDLRPQGFIGRQIARDMARDSSDFPANPRYWSTDHVGRYLLTNGEDLPGNFIVGEAGLHNNTDMHPGNISLAVDGNTFRVLSAYDMCSMGFRPMGDEVPPYRFKPESLHSRLNTLRGSPRAMAKVVDTAIDFWDRLAADARISDDLRDFLASGNPVM